MRMLYPHRTALCKGQSYGVRGNLDTMIINGKKMAEGIKAELAREVALFEEPPVLGIVQVGDDPVVSRYVGVKKRFGEAIGVGVIHEQLSASASTEEVVATIERLSFSAQGEPRKVLDELGPRGGHRGLIVQLPLPPTLDANTILDSISLEHDVDVLSESACDNFADGTSIVAPPVVAAIAEIFNLHHVELQGRRVAVIGYGRLVGKPVSVWLRHEGALVDIFTKTDDLTDALHDQDIIISGTGVPGLIAPNMVREGVVLVDVGTSDAEGKLKGDIDATCAPKATLYTPVPGGVGPLTVAMLFKNLITLATKQ